MNRNRIVAIGGVGALVVGMAAASLGLGAATAADSPVGTAADLAAICANATDPAVIASASLSPEDVAIAQACVRIASAYPTGASPSPSASSSASPSVSPSASPSSSASPSPSPSASSSAPPGFPDATNTGPTGALPLWTHSIDFSTPGQVVSNVTIDTGHDTMSILANNVTFNNVKIVYTGPIDNANIQTAIRMAVGVTGTKFLHCEVDGQDHVARAIQGYNDVDVEFCNIHDAGNGIEVSNHITAKDNFIHNIFTPAGQDWHSDGIQTDAYSQVSGILVQHNTILLPGSETGAINMITKSDGNGHGHINNCQVLDNLFAGGSYTMYAGGAVASDVTNYNITGNHFSTRYFPLVGQFGVWYPNVSGAIRSGNVIDETGVPV